MQLDMLSTTISMSDCRSRDCKFKPKLRLIMKSFIHYSHSPLLLIQEGQLSVSDESIYAQVLFNHLED